MTKAVLKLTHQEAVVKVWGTDTIVLADLVAAGDQLGVDPTANIVGVTWMGDPAAVIEIERGGTPILTLTCAGANYLDLSGQDLPPDTINNTDDLDVTITGAGQAYIKLRKTSGYLNMVETATYGAYDDETRVGASLTMSGSPDKV